MPTAETATDDLTLLREYSQNKSEQAFASLVSRYINLVYSVALRQVGNAHIAEEITQAVFITLARKAGSLDSNTILPGWLCRTARYTSANALKTQRRQQQREQEAHMQTLLNETEANAWEHVAPLLEPAMAQLGEKDHDALVLRYFDGRSLKEVGLAMGTSEEAAKKRVNRALERLRAFLSNRNVTIGASGLVVLISANAVQAAPAGLAFTISTAAFAGTSISTAAVVASTKTIVMTTLQKSLITATVALAAGVGIFEAHRASDLEQKLELQQRSQAPQAEQIQQLEKERSNLVDQVSALTKENERLRKTAAEIPKLRGEVVRSRTVQQQGQTGGLNANDPIVKSFLMAREAGQQIGRYLQQMPDKAIPELKLLTDVDWLAASKEANFDTDADIRRTLSHLRSLAKNRLPLGAALGHFIKANDGRLPNDLLDLKPYFPTTEPPLDGETLNAILSRYKLLHTGTISDLPADRWLIAEKASVDRDYDSRAKFGRYRSTTISTGIGEVGDPEDKSY